MRLIIPATATLTLICAAYVFGAGLDRIMTAQAAGPDPSSQMNTSAVVPILAAALLLFVLVGCLMDARPRGAAAFAVALVLECAVVAAAIASAMQSFAQAQGAMLLLTVALSALSMMAVAAAIWVSARDHLHSEFG